MNGFKICRYESHFTVNCHIIKSNLQFKIQGLYRVYKTIRSEKNKENNFSQIRNLLKAHYSMNMHNLRLHEIFELCRKKCILEINVQRWCGLTQIRKYVVLCYCILYTKWIMYYLTSINYSMWQHMWQVYLDIRYYYFINKATFDISRER